MEGVEELLDAAPRVSLDGGADQGAHLHLCAGAPDRTVDAESSPVGIGSKSDRSTASDQGRRDEDQRGENPDADSNDGGAAKSLQVP